MKLQTILFASLLPLAACGKKDEGGAAPKPDDTRAKAGMATGSGSAGAAATGTGKPDLPPPPAGKGQTRVVNLWLGPDGKTQAVDVWAKRSFQYGPARLAENVAFAAVSAPFGIVEGMSTAVFKAGATADAKDAELGGLFGTKDGEKNLGLLYNKDGAPSVALLPEAGPNDALVAPPAGKGLVVLYAGALRAFETELTATVGSSSFYVGDGSGACRKQRIEETMMSDGKTPMQAMILGGTQRPELVLDPGKHKLTFHKWPGDGCKTPAAFDAEVEVAAGAGTWAFLYTADKAKVSVLTVPAAL